MPLVPCFDAATVRRTAVLLLGVTSSGCFGQPTAIESDTEGDTTSPSATSRGTADSTGDTSDTGAAELDAEATSDGNTTGPESMTGGSDSTGEPPRDCSAECPREAWACEGFERWPPAGWSQLSQPVTEVVPTADDPHCGAAAAETFVPDGGSYTAFIYAVPGDVAAEGSLAARTWVRIDASCLENPTPARVLRVQFPSDTGGPAYTADVQLRNGGGQLWLTDEVGVVKAVEFESPSVVPEAWIELQLDARILPDGIYVSVAIDGTAFETMQPPAMTPPPYFEPSVVLGPYLNDAPFQGDCAMQYDDVWIGPSTP
jgi:hypothetical protein